MKKLLIGTNIISLAVIGWLTLGPKSCGPVNPPRCYSTDEEIKGETFNHFKEVTQLYRTERWDMINQNKFNNNTSGLNYASLKGTIFTGTSKNLYDTSDARSIWFPLDTIKKFIYTIEKYNDSLDNKPKHLGIRFYYAVYDNLHSVIERRNRHTLFMMPTFSHTPNGFQEDFDPRFSLELQRKRAIKETSTIAQTLNFIPSTARFMIIGGDGSGVIQNTGDLCPTNCSTTLPLIDQ